MLIGIPATGKSTWTALYCNKNSKTVVVCPDELRKIHGESVNDQTVNEKVWKIAKQQIIDALNQKRSVILDATNVRSKLRRSLLKYITARVDYFYPIGILFDGDPHLSYTRICKDIGEGKDRAFVPFEKVQQMHDIFKRDSNEKLNHDGFSECRLANNTPWEQSDY